MNGWLALGCMAAVFAAGLWVQHALGGFMHDRQIRAAARRREAARWPARSRMEEGIDVLLWDKEIRPGVLDD